jgi:hypothetical protein
VANEVYDNIKVGVEEVGGGGAGGGGGVDLHTSPTLHLPLNKNQKTALTTRPGRLRRPEGRRRGPVGSFRRPPAAGRLGDCERDGRELPAGALQKLTHPGRLDSVEFGSIRLTWAPLAASESATRDTTPRTHKHILSHSKHTQDAGGRPFARAALEQSGGTFSSDPAFGTQSVFVPRTAAGLPGLLAQIGVLIDETYYAAAPALFNISSSLGFGSEAAAAEGVPAIANNLVFRCVCLCAVCNEYALSGGSCLHLHACTPASFPHPQHTDAPTQVGRTAVRLWWHRLV